MFFTITVLRTSAVIRLCVFGDLDLGTAGQLDRAINEALRAEPVSVLVDLAATTFCDCAAVTVLLAGQRNAGAHAVDYQVINPTGISLRVLQLLDLHEQLTTRSG